MALNLSIILTCHHANKNYTKAQSKFLGEPYLGCRIPLGEWFGRKQVKFILFFTAEALLVISFEKIFKKSEQNV